MRYDVRSSYAAADVAYPGTGEDDRLAQSQVVSTIDLAHRAAPEETHDPIARCEDAAGRKPRLIDRPELREGAIR